MTVTTGDGRLASPAARSIRRDSKQAGTLGQLSRADRVALGKDARIERAAPAGLVVSARVCGSNLARAHARSGDRVALAAYLGGSDAFDQTIADFAETYVDQNERDYAALQNAVNDGRAEATTDI